MSLESYAPTSEHQKTTKAALLQFMAEHEDHLHRSLEKGHLTGSAFVVNPQRTHCLLMHHAKLDIWVQLGGHADGDPDLLAVATKEAHEESGLESITLVSPEVFDLDIHEIPPHKGIPAHLHFDVRYLFEANPDEPLVVNRESKDLKWIPLEEVGNFTGEESMLRMVREVVRRSSGE